MSTLAKAGWNLCVENALASLHHERPHTLIILEQIRDRFYVTEGDLDRLLCRSVGKAQDGTNAGVELNDEEIPPLIDVIDILHNGAREYEQQMFEAEYNLVFGTLEMMF